MLKSTFSLNYRSLDKLLLQAAIQFEYIEPSILETLNLPGTQAGISNLAIQLAILTSVFRKGGIYEKIEYQLAVYCLFILANNKFKTILRSIVDIKDFEKVEKYVKEISNEMQPIDIQGFVAYYAKKTIENKKLFIMDHLEEIIKLREC